MMKNINLSILQVSFLRYYTAFNLKQTEEVDESKNSQAIAPHWLMTF